MKAQRVTSSWEWATWSNPPATTSVGEVIATESASALDLAPDIPSGTWTWKATDFAKAWASGAPNYGIMLRPI
ncbi:hypothetical protein [Nonomuraea sp. 10N515B]|uniref:hypothetical protein n=1 Tax=Nonomuraea sp. 10N515B TaxID=3457422 RepID=UPI003FCE132F